MAQSQDQVLCNGIPIDHRLIRFLQNAKQTHSVAVGKHAEIVENFGNTMVRDDRSYPCKNEAGFAAWLAKPDMQGGIVVALLQPAKSQIYTSDVQWVKGQCATLAYLEESIAFVTGRNGLATTSVFDAFPFITKQISPEEPLSNEALNSHDKYIDMLEAKKPDVVFTCWQDRAGRLRFSGKGIGATNEVQHVALPSGHFIRVVNGFHPSYAANYHPNESSFRRLFTVELCKAFCELNQAWEEERWMGILRSRCRRLTSELMTEKEIAKDNLRREGTRVLRGAAKGGQQEKVERYKKSFDKGLQHIKATFDFMDSDTYQTKSPWDVYAHLVFKNNTSEGFCDALLALTESMPNSGLVELGRYTSAQTRSFLNDYFPGLLQDSRNDQQKRLYSRFARSQSQGLKQDLERITTKFVKDLTLSFSVISRSWTYVPDLLYSAFKDLAVDFEKSLGKEYDLYRWNSAQRAPGYVGNRAQRTTNNYDHLSASLQNLSLSSAPNGSPRRPAPHLVCFKCHVPGHLSPNCQNPRRRGCYKCGRVDHIGNNCNF